MTRLRLGVPVEVTADLHEHDRGNVGFLGAAEFEQAVADFFARPGELVLGRETAEQARARFAAAVSGVLAAHPGEDVTILAHGTVISLFVAACAGVEPFALWKRLGLPSFVVLTLPELAVANVVEGMGQPGEQLEPGLARKVGQEGCERVDVAAVAVDDQHALEAVAGEAVEQT